MPAAPRRPRYFAGQLLTAEILDAEQSYLLRGRRSDNRLLHGWGVVCGLGLKVSGRGGVVVEPGVAVDGLGREIVVPERRKMPDPRQPIDDHGEPCGERVESELLTICLAYAERPEGNGEAAPFVRETYTLEVRAGRIEPPPRHPAADAVLSGSAADSRRRYAGRRPARRAIRGTNACRSGRSTCGRESPAWCHARAQQSRPPTSCSTSSWASSGACRRSSSAASSGSRPAPAPSCGILEQAMAHDNVKVVERLIAAVNERDIDGYLACCTEDIRLQTPWAPVEGTYEGREAITRFFADLRDTLPDFRLRIESAESIGAARVLAFVRASVSGRASGIPVADMMGGRARDDSGTGDLGTANVYDFVDGKIASIRVFLDRAEAVEAARLQE
jgi:ketosteroid isomerase-like protein